jgi:integrase
LSSRRGAGEGAVFFVPSLNRWRAVITVGDVNGKRKRVARNAKTKKEAIARLLELQRQLAEGTGIPDRRTTVIKYLQWWSETVLPWRVKESTARDYRWIVSHYVEPAFGKLLLADLSALHIESLDHDLQTRGLSPSTRRQVFSVLSGALKQAKRDHLISRSPMDGIDWPKVSRTGARDAINGESVQAIMRAAKETRLAALIHLAFSTGMRQGELLALRWNDINLETRELQVCGTLKWRPASQGHPRWYIDSTKTEDSARLIVLAESAAEALSSWRSQQAQERLRLGPGWEDHGFVFTTPVGTPLDGSAVRKYLKELCRSAGVPEMRFHATRHTTATLLLNEGEPLVIISKLLGHRDTGITSRIYAEVKRKPLESAAVTIDRLMTS